MGITASELLRTYLNVNIPWYIISIAAWLLVLSLSSVSAKQSLKLSLMLFAAEVGIIIILAVIVLSKGGYDGIHLSVFTPSLSPTGFSGIALGMV